MINKTDEIIMKTKSQIKTICGELVKHSSAIDKMISDEGPVNNPYIQGHMEAHLEKIEESLQDLYLKYELSEKQILMNEETTLNKDAKQLETQRQSMKLMLNNIKKIEAQVKNVLPGVIKRKKGTRVLPLKELSRKLKNDLCRTSYLLQ